MIMLLQRVQGPDWLLGQKHIKRREREAPATQQSVLPGRPSVMALILASVLISAIPVTYCFPTAFQDLGGLDKNRTSLKFLAIGDWGGVPYPPYITAVQKATAHEMSKVAEQMGADFVLALGDNFYYTGVESVDSPRFKSTFENVYTQPSLQVPWYVLAGNHDHKGSVKAQIEYSTKSKRWRFPDYYYELDFRVADVTLTIIMLDTVTLCGKCDDFLGEKPTGPLDQVAFKHQLLWLEERLARSRADFLLVAGHYPVWSVSEHGPTQCLVDNLLPLLKKYNATAYFCGHDHNLQYIEHSNVGYVVSGAGNFIDPDVSHWNKVPKGSVKFFSGSASTLGGFAHVEATKDKMAVTFFQAKGTSLYRTILSRRNF